MLPEGRLMVGEIRTGGDAGRAGVGGRAAARPPTRTQEAAPVAALALPRVAPPRPRRVTPDSLSIRWTKPYERPVSSASARMLAPESYFLLSSDASFSRAAPVTRLPFFRVSATRASS